MYQLKKNLNQKILNINCTLICISTPYYTTELRTNVSYYLFRPINSVSCENVNSEEIPLL